MQPNPSKQFIVEVDASKTGVGAILSQASDSNHKIHPCLFFSCRLSPTERNYDVGDRELLAIKLALEEWRHWLEGAEHPVLVWTNHKYLSYRQSDKRLNPLQSRWSLFFSGFNLSISYCPGSRNITPDALSRLHLPYPTLTLRKNLPPSYPPAAPFHRLHGRLKISSTKPNKPNLI